MTGVSRAPRLPASAPSALDSVARDSAALERRVRRPSRGVARGLLGGSVVLAAFAAAACQSELDDTAGAGLDAVPGFSGAPVGPGGAALPDGTSPGVGSNLPPGSVPGAAGGPASDGVIDPADVINMPGRVPPTLTGTGDVGPVVDEAGAPLPVEELPPLMACSTPGPQVLRRLNSAQLRNTLTAVFGEGNVPDSNPLNDPLTLGYDVDSDDLVVQGLDAQAIGSLAEEIAAAVRESGAIAQLANNCTNINDNNCRQQFVRNVGERLSREPLSAERVGTYTALFTKEVDGVPLSNSFDEAAELVIAAMIQSPYSIYRREIGTQQGGEYVLTPFEVASELSYMLTNSPPDGPLPSRARRAGCW